MDAARFDAFHREHEEFLSDVARLEEAITGDPSPGSPDFARSIAGFLRRYDARIAPHLAAEAAEVYPLLERYLPPDTASADSLQREQETLHGLIETIRANGRKAADEDAFSETLTAASDVIFLLRDLIRKEDQVIHPLLRRLLGEDAGG